MRYRMPAALKRISAIIYRNKLGRVKPQDAAMLMWGLGKLAFKPQGQLLDQLPHVLITQLGSFKPQVRRAFCLHVPCGVPAFGRGGLEGRLQRFYTRTRTLPRIPHPPTSPPRTPTTYPPQEICNVLYGYALLRHYHPALLDAVAAAAAPRLPEFSSQDLVITIWAYGVLGHLPADGALLDAACAQLLERRRALLPLQVAIALKGLTKAGYRPSAEFMEAFSELTLERLPAFKPVELCHVLWAHARLEYRDVRLVESVVAHIVALLQSSPQPLPKITVDTVVWAAQQVGFWPQALIDTAELRGIYVRHGPLTAGSNGGGSSMWDDEGPEEGGLGADDSSVVGSSSIGPEFTTSSSSRSIRSSSSSSRSIGSNGAGQSSGSSPISSVSRQQGESGQQRQAGGRLIEQQQDDEEEQPPWRRLEVNGLPEGALALDKPQQQQRRPPPVALSLLQWKQGEQLARHQNRQQQHQQQADGQPPDDAAAGGDESDGVDQHQPAAPSAAAAAPSQRPKRPGSSSSSRPRLFESPELGDMTPGP